MTAWLIKVFIRDKKKGQKATAQRFGYLCGFVGIFTNALLAVLKIIIGLASGSIAIIADAVNNFSDMGASIVTLFGFYYAGKPADQEHPFGHGRAEYLSALFLSVMVIVVGFRFLTTSVERIRNPIPLTVSVVTLVILIASIAVKIWQSRFYKNIGERIASQTLKAAAADSMSDVAITGIVVLSMLLAKFTSFPIDGYIGLIVSLLIMYNGYGIIKDTIDPILGCAPDPELMEALNRAVRQVDGVMGVHDLIVHSYGTGVLIASIHVEVSDKLSFVEAHEIADRAEREIWDAYEIRILVHLDPIDFDDPTILQMHDGTKQFLKCMDERLSIHDFRVIPKREKELVFDLDVPIEYEDRRIAEVKSQVRQYLKEQYGILVVHIEVDRGNLIA